jgi:hypothetical protein
MTNEHHRRIRSLCRQIEIEQDQELFMRLVMELNQLLETDELQSGFAAKSKLNGNGHQPADNRTAVFTSSYEKIVDDAVAVMRSDYASVQMLFPERNRRRTAADGLPGIQYRGRQILGVGTRRLKKYRRNRAPRNPPAGRARHNCLRLYGRFRRSAGLSSDRDSRLPNYAADRPRRKRCRDDLRPLAQAPSTLRAGFWLVRHSGKTGSRLDRTLQARRSAALSEE